MVVVVVVVRTGFGFRILRDWFFPSEDNFLSNYGALYLGKVVKNPSRKFPLDAYAISNSCLPAFFDLSCRLMTVMMMIALTSRFFFFRNFSGGKTRALFLAAHFTNDPSKTTGLSSRSERPTFLKIGKKK